MDEFQEEVVELRSAFTNLRKLEELTADPKRLLPDTQISIDLEEALELARRLQAVEAQMMGALWTKP